MAALDSDNDEAMDEDLDDDFIALANASGDDESDGERELPDRQRKWIEEQYMGDHSQYVLINAILISVCQCFSNIRHTGKSWKFA